MITNLVVGHNLDLPSSTSGNEVILLQIFGIGMKGHETGEDAGDQLL